jgi:hypothetical protein
MSLSVMHHRQVQNDDGGGDEENDDDNVPVKTLISKSTLKRYLKVSQNPTISFFVQENEFRQFLYLWCFIHASVRQEVSNMAQGPSALPLVFIEFN